jgi:DNA-binding MarR family transcriptional regulator
MILTDEVRGFNRFYTREIGLLNRRLPATDFSLPEARVLYELAQAPAEGRTAAEIGRALGMDKGRNAGRPTGSRPRWRARSFEP